MRQYIVIFLSSLFLSTISMAPGFKQIGFPRLWLSEMTTRLLSTSANKGISPTTRQYTLQGPDKVLHAVISGGGPAGLLTALCLLSRGYKVTLHEAREDPKGTPLGPRAFSLGLNIRGQNALKYFEPHAPGLWDAIRKNGIGSDAFFLHIGNTELKIRTPISPNTYTSVTTWNAVPPPTLMIPRNKLASAMLDVILKHYEPGGKFKVVFSSKLENVDFDEQKCRFSSGVSEAYDLLVGADGVQSAVRDAMILKAQASTATAEEASFQAEEVVLPGRYVVLVDSDGRLNSTLQAGAVHAMENTKADFGLFVIPAPAGDGRGTCTLLSWRKDERVPDIVKEIMESSESNRIAAYNKARRSIAQCYPKFGSPSDVTLSQIVQQRPSEARTIRCNCYHNKRASVLILGDSAHSTGGTLGQGANSALMDVVELDRCLETHSDDIPKAIEAFSKKQVPEGLALWKLLQIPSKLPGLLKLAYALSNFISGILSKIVPRIFRSPTQILLSQTLTPFSEIEKLNNFWIKIALRNFKKIEPQFI